MTAIKPTKMVANILMIASIATNIRWSILHLIEAADRLRFDWKYTTIYKNAYAAMLAENQLPPPFSRNDGVLESFYNPIAAPPSLPSNADSKSYAILTSHDYQDYIQDFERPLRN